MSTPVRNRKPTKRALESTSPIIANQLKKKRPPVGTPSPKSTPPTTPPKASSATTSALLAAINASATPTATLKTSPVLAPATTPPSSCSQPITAKIVTVVTTSPAAATAAVPTITTANATQLTVSNVVELGAVNSNTPSPVPSESEDKEKKETKTFIFKDPNFTQQSKGSSSGRRTRLGKSLKQIITSERTLPWKPDDVSYGSIDAPPSFCPSKRYSDITGLPAKYTDPQTKIRYATTEEFARIRILPSDIIAGYLTLRKANTPVP